MKRRPFLAFLALLIMMAASGCSGNNSVLENYETALAELKDADLYDVFLKKNEVDLIVVGEKMSIVNGNNGWKKEETTLSSKYTKEFPIAGYDVLVTLDADYSGKFIDSISYSFSNCDVEDAIAIGEALVKAYGNPDESEKDDHGITSTYKWNGIGFMMYTPLLDQVHFYSISE